MTLPRKFPVNARILRNIQSTIAPKNGETYLINRNPRNLEYMRIAHKPNGYELDKPGRCFWNKLNLVSSGKFVTAQVEHFQNQVVIEASTSEWAIKKQLYKTSDFSAYVNLARVFAQRCLESGIIEMRCDMTNPQQGTKVEAFLNTLKDHGILLKEAGQIRPQKEMNFYKGRNMKPYGDWEEH